MFTWLVDVSIQNAWILGREANGTDCDCLLTFCHSIETFCSKHYGSAPKRPERHSSNAPAKTELRFNSMDHFVVRNEGNARRRAYCGSRIVCMVANDAIVVFALSVSSTTVRKAKQNELLLNKN